MLPVPMTPILMWNSSTARRSLYVSLPARRRCERSRASASLPSLNSPLDLSAPLVGRSGVAVFVVPVPPFVRRSLRVALGRVFPLLLAPERSHIEVAPGAPERLVAAVVDEVVS